MSMPANHFKSCVAIDLGASYTGVCTINHYADEAVKPENITAGVVVLPEDGNGFVYSMKNRTAVRHRVRSKKRFHLARRLLMLIIDNLIQEHEIALSSEHAKQLKEALSGLLKRRGYSRVETEADLTSLEKVDASVFASHSVLGKYFYEGTSLAQQWEELTNDLRKVQEMLSTSDLPSDKDFRDYLKTEFPEYAKEGKLYAGALSTIKTDARNIINQQSMGHKHRREYLKVIRSEITKDSRLIPAVQALGGEDRLWCLIGNLSNLQLRAHRWYFNAPEMVSEDRLVYSRLKKTVVRAFKYFHPDSQDKQRLHQLIERLENSENIVSALCEINPEITIPPYEDQNNRRPPLDQTLYLSPQALSHCYQQRWLLWADSFLRAEPILDENLDEILALTDRKSRIAHNQEVLPLRQYQACYVLQRVLDRSRLRDAYALRLLSQGADSQVAKKAFEHLTNVIGKQHVDEFLSMASDYYAEVAKAKSGLWMPQEARLLERADIHPPMKKKILDILVGNLFVADDVLGAKVRRHWLDKVHGNSSVASLCRSIETVRKDYGNEFNSLYRQLNQNGATVDKAIKDVQKKVERLTQYFKDLGLTDHQVQCISNPYSLSQLYTLIETDRMGFTSTSLAAHLENVWRMSHSDGLEAAQCSRLPADSVRPFDGTLRRCLDRQAWEVARLYAREIKRQVKDHHIDIDVGILIEQNKFEFSASLASLKKDRKAQKKAEQLTEKTQQRWLSKKDELIQSSQGICAYTGKPIGKLAEVDHIIPRSYTQKHHGTIFNSAVNLIYVSQEGNQAKANRMLWLQDLHPNYLKAVFNTNDVSKIEQEIETGVMKLVKTKRLQVFDLLSTYEKNLCRHALFLPDGSQAKEAVIATLGSLRKTKVNGTQSWYVRELMIKIRQELGPWLAKTHNHLAFDAQQVQAEQVSSIRDNLASVQPQLQKLHPQPVFSHAIDALCCYAQASTQEAWCQHMQAPRTIADDPKALLALIPSRCELMQISAMADHKKTEAGSRSIFRDGIIAQNFLPILVKNNEIFVGFGLPEKNAISSASAVRVQGKDPKCFLEPLLGFLTPSCELEHLQDGSYRIDKTRALEFLHKVAIQPATPQECECADLLEGLSYFTTRVPIDNHLLDNNGKRLKNEQAILKDSSFMINLDCKANKQKIKGKIMLPSRAQWVRLLEHQKIKEHLGKELGDLSISELLQEDRCAGSTRPHAKTRRVFSLPILATASGLVRIRKRVAKGNLCIQVRNVNQAKFSGFICSGRELDWKNPAMRDAFKSPNVSAHKARFQDKDSPVTSMDEFRCVKEDKDACMKVEIAPGSADRRIIRITMPFSRFKEWTQCEYASFYELPARWKMPSPKDFETAAGEWATLIGHPRIDVVFEEIGEKVVFTYSVNNSKSSMNTAYNQAPQS